MEAVEIQSNCDQDDLEILISVSKQKCINKLCNGKAVSTKVVRIGNDPNWKASFVCKGCGESWTVEYEWRKS